MVVTAMPGHWRPGGVAPAIRQRNGSSLLKRALSIMNGTSHGEGCLGSLAYSFHICILEMTQWVLCSFSRRFSFSLILS